MKTILLLFLSVLFVPIIVCGQMKSVKSPDGKLVTTIYYEDEIRYELLYNGKSLILPSPISLSLADGRILGKKPILTDSKASSNQSFVSNSRYRKTKIENNYNELILKFKGNYSIAFRLFNDGLAYRFITSIPGNIKVMDETCSFRFSASDDNKIWYIPKDNVVNSGEGSYSVSKISDMEKKKIALTPVLVKSDQINALVFEADLFDYPKMFLENDPAFPNSIKGKFSREMITEVQNADGWGWTPTEYADYIAETNGQRNFPWRCIMVTENDAALVDCDMVYRLATPPVGDYSWVKPGKAAWDWWYDWNIEGVDFKGDTASNEFYKYVIDFAYENSIEFIEISVGWSKNDMITQESPTLDIREIMRYAKSKNVGVLLWVCANRFMADYEKSFALFDELKPVGIKVDFMDGDHQTRMKYYEKIAKDCAQHKFMVYFHGAHTPTGLQVTYPNVINYEAVKGNEHNKWSEDISPDYTTILPFIRNAVGPMDFTPGGMLNATKVNFKISNDKPMVLGTRCHQLAEYVVFFGPTQMVCDAPSNYKNEKESLQLISEIPTVWEQSLPIAGKVGEYIIIAREKNQKWYVGAMSNWTGRDVTFKTDFLEKNVNYIAVIYKDGINADRFATDYKIEEFSLNSESEIHVHLAPGGGFVIKILKLDI
jgi:alpha-glucosidase